MGCLTKKLNALNVSSLTHVAIFQTSASSVRRLAPPRTWSGGLGVKTTFLGGAFLFLVAFEQFVDGKVVELWAIPFGRQSLTFRPE